MGKENAKQSLEFCTEESCQSEEMISFSSPRRPALHKIRPILVILGGQEVANAILVYDGKVCP